MTTTTEFRTPEETALQLELLLLGTLTSRESPEGPVAALPVTDAKLSREIRRLSDRVHMLSTQGEDGIGVIGAVTASRRALASTWIAASVAAKRPVTLVDADLRYAHLSFDEGTYAQEGLVDVLRYGVRSPRVVAPTQVPGVSLLPVGSGTVDLAGTWASDAVEPLLRELVRSGDFLVINGPGIEDLDDAGPLLDRISSWMLVHEIGLSDSEETRRIRDRIGADRIIGVLVLHPGGASEPSGVHEGLREVLKTRVAETVEQDQLAYPAGRGKKRTGLFAVAGVAAVAAALLIPRLFSQQTNATLSDAPPVEEPWTADEGPSPPKQQPREEPKEVLPEGTVEPLAPAPMLTPSGKDNASTSALQTKDISTTARTNNVSPPTQNLPTNPPPTNSQSSSTSNPPPANSLPAKPAPAKPAPANPTPTEAAAPSSSAKFGVHVSSMQTEAKAQQEADRFQAAGYPAFVRRVDLGEKGIWHRVYAGPYDDRAAADRAAQEVRDRGLTDYTLVQRISGRSSASGS